MNTGVDPMLLAEASSHTEESRTRRALLHMLEDLQRERGLVEQGRRQWLDTVDAIGDPLMVHDSQGRIVRVNQAYVDLAGAGFAEVIGRPYWEVFPRRDGPLPGCIGGGCCSGERPDQELEVNGDFYSSRAFEIHADARAGCCALHLFANVTRQRRDEQRVQSRNLRKLAHADALAAIASSEALHAGDIEKLAGEITEQVARACGAQRASIWLFDPETTQLRCLDGFEAVARNHSPALALRRKQFEFDLDPQPGPSVLESIVTLSGHQLGVLRVEHGHAGHRWEDDEVAFAARAAERMSIAISNRDARRAEQAMQTSDRRLRTIFQQSPVGIAELSLDGRYLRVNPRMCAITGYAGSELCERGFRDITHPDDVARDELYLKKMLAGEEQLYAAEKRYLRKDGGEVWVALRVTPMRCDDGDIVSMLTIAEDVTERRRAQQALARYARALKTLSSCNEALVRATDEAQLLGHICRLIIEVGGYRMAWVGFAEHDAQRSVAVAAKFGAHGDYLLDADIRWADNERGHGPVGTAIRESAIQLVPDIHLDPRFAPWRENALRHGYASTLALPLRAGEEAFGALCIHAGQSDAFDTEEIKLLGELAGDLAFGIVNLRLRADHEHSARRLQRSMEATVRSIAATVEMRDPYTTGHQNRVAELAVAIAREMGLAENEVHGIQLAGVVHDVGKIRIPVELLSKPTRLSAIEFEIIKTHADASHDILKDVDFPWPIADIVWQHHERLDGSGYPRGLRGAEITLGARIIAVADTTEAMASNRPYRAGLGIDVALAEIERQRGILYDADAVDACLRLFRQKGFVFSVSL